MNCPLCDTVLDYMGETNIQTIDGEYIGVMKVHTCPDCGYWRNEEGTFGSW